MESNKGRITLGKNKTLDIVKKKASKLKESAWFLMVNSNVAFKDDDSLEYTAFEEAFGRALDRLFKSKDAILSVVDVIGDKPRDYEKCRYVFQTELAPVTTYLHGHGILLLIHRSCLCLASRRLQNLILQYLKEEVGGTDLPVPKGVYCKYRLITDYNSKELNKAKMMEYIEKNKFSMENTEDMKMEKLKRQLDDDTELLSSDSSEDKSDAVEDNDPDEVEELQEPLEEDYPFEEGEGEYNTEDEVIEQDISLELPSVSKPLSSVSENIPKLDLKIPDYEQNIVGSCVV